MKAKGRCEGFVGGKKWKAEEEWVIKENAHEPLITDATAAIIKAIKDGGLREEPGQTTRTYALSGIMKCAECGTNYTGDRGLYRCNSLAKTGGRCGNNDISQRKVEQVVLSFIGQCVLKFNDVKKALDRVKKKFSNGETQHGSKRRQNETGD